MGLIPVAGARALDDEEQLQEFKRHRAKTARQNWATQNWRSALCVLKARQDQKMSFSEKLVDGLAVSILFLGFVTGVIAKPMNKSPHEITLNAHSLAAPSQQNQDARRAILHS